MRATVVAVVIAGVAASAQTTGTRDKEAALGAAMAQDIRRRTHSLESASVSDYVARVGARIAKALPDVPWSFQVIADPLGDRLREPVALPGGYLFIPARLLLATVDESEFAGMLAHAMAHVAERHGVRNATRTQLSNSAEIPLIYMGPWPGSGDEALVPVGFVAFQRQYELEADGVAARAVAAAGYDPAALARYIGRMQPDDSERSRFSPLPPRAARLDALDQLVRELPANSPQADEGFAAVQDEIRRLMAEPPPQARKIPSLQRN